MKEKIGVVDAVNQMHQRRYQAGINMLYGVTKSSIENEKKLERKFERMVKINKLISPIFEKFHKKES
jgi:hypothetical protein